MDENDKIQILKHIRHLQVTVDIIIEMIEVGGESISYILHNLNVLYIEIENLIKKVNSDGME